MKGAGERRYKITLFQPTSMQTASGNVRDTFERCGEVWAARENAGIRSGFGEQVLGEQYVGRQTMLFNIYYREDVKSTWELECEGLRYKILAVRPIGFREELELEAEYRDNG